MTYFILFISLAIIFYRLIKRKEITSLVLTYILFAPSVAVGGLRFDSTYIIAVFLLIYVVFFKARFKISLPMKRYLKMLLMICTIYIIAWSINNRSNFVLAAISMAGILKIGLILWMLMNIDEIKNYRDLNGVILKFLKYTIILNILAVIAQMIIPVQMHNLGLELFRSDTSAYYTDITDVWELSGGFFMGSFYRYFGLHPSPMLLACYSLFALGYLYYQSLNSRDNSFFKKLYCLFCLLLGMVTFSKTFILGLPVVILICLVVSKSNYKKYSLFLGGSGIAIACILFFNQILSFLSNVDPRLAFYFAFLGSPFDAFNTRLGGDTSSGLLVNTLEMIRLHPIIGVGPTSIAGEFIGDNAYVVILHHGGILAFSVVMMYFVGVLYRSIIRKQYEVFIMTCTVLLTSFGMTTLVGSNTSLFVIYYIINSEYLFLKSNNNTEQLHIR